MRGTARVLVLIAALSLLAADVSVGCGQAYIYGVVDQKWTRTADDDVAEGRLLVAGQSVYVPLAFYMQVQQGDTVKFDGRNWTIVKHAGKTEPTSSTP